MKKKTKVVDSGILYKVTAQILGKKYNAEGATISEAISNLKPMNCKGKCILTVEGQFAKKDKILFPAVTYRLFNMHGLSREVAIKNTANLFNGI
jgi:hypothetical protein